MSNQEKPESLSKEAVPATTIPEQSELSSYEQTAQELIGDGFTNDVDQLFEDINYGRRSQNLKATLAYVDDEGKKNVYENARLTNTPATGLAFKLPDNSYVTQEAFRYRRHWFLKLINQQD